jgi:hypothetical protein
MLGLQGAAGTRKVVDAPGRLALGQGVRQAHRAIDAQPLGPETRGQVDLVEAKRLNRIAALG